MADHVKQGGQIVLILTDAEARALRDVAIFGEHEIGSGDGFAAFGISEAPMKRAIAALTNACAEHAPIREGQT